MVGMKPGTSEYETRTMINAPSTRLSCLVVEIAAIITFS
jgi:hypothetical protein